jgi:hypothetical protein
MALRKLQREEEARNMQMESAIKEIRTLQAVRQVQRKARPGIYKGTRWHQEQRSYRKLLYARPTNEREARAQERARSALLEQQLESYVPTPIMYSRQAQAFWNSTDEETKRILLDLKEISGDSMDSVINVYIATL